MTDALWLVLFPVGVAAMAGGMLAWLRPKWSTRRTTLMAALPLPTLGALVCLVMFGSALLTDKEKCGVDACGMLMMFSLIGLGYAAVAAGLGAVIAFLLKRTLMRR
ncbi:MAG TPA: hypothetical protein VFQ57_08530 [Sphingomonas sp.]|jgi:hypothetical protein|nr:hypothetical protein [Sphingomonas sp.]